MKTILSITGSDGTGGSGVQADIRAISILGAQAVTAITSITVQNTLGIQSFYDLPASVVREQIEAIFNDVDPQIVKIGMLRRIGHIAEAQILQAIEIDYIDESEVLSPADDIYHIDKTQFKVPFVCGARDLGETLAVIDGHIVAARQGRQLVTAFHPELDEDLRVHEYFLSLCQP